jgi:hypothetical protein
MAEPRSAEKSYPTLANMSNLLAPLHIYLMRRLHYYPYLVQNAFLERAGFSIPIIAYCRMIVSIVNRFRNFFNLSSFLMFLFRLEGLVTDENNGRCFRSKELCHLVTASIAVPDACLRDNLREMAKDIMFILKLNPCAVCLETLRSFRF